MLRVVGDRTFFMNLPLGSTLRALAAFATNDASFQVTKMHRIPSCPPDLSMEDNSDTAIPQHDGIIAKVRQIYPAKHPFCAGTSGFESFRQSCEGKGRLAYLMAQWIHGYEGHLGGSKP